MSISERQLQKPYPPIPHVETSTAENGYGWRGSGYGWQMESFTGPKSSTARKKGTEVPDIPIFDVNPPVDASSISLKYGESSSSFLPKAQPQDFYKLRNENLRNGTLFEDPDFPADATSLRHTIKPDVEEIDFNEFVWLRPKEIVKTPELFVRGYTRFDVIQGRLGNSWVITAMACLAMHPRLFLKIVPDDNRSFEEKYAGIFYFRFWQYGRWIYVVIDDRLPTHNGKLVYLHSKEENEFWGALLEKAYAKLYGSYEALNSGSARDAMQDFTGGVTERYKLKDMAKNPQNIFKMLLKSFERGSLISANITPTSEEEAVTQQGLIGNHTYTISNMKNVQPLYVTRKIPLLRIRQPWGDGTEWNGPWSTKSLEWQNITEEVKRELGLTFDDEGEFWMTYHDFETYFTEVEICNLTIETLSQESINKGYKKWNMSMFEGLWLHGLTAGGNKLDTLCYNPQYRINLVHPDDGDNDSNCTLIVSLTQKHRRPMQPIGVSLLFISFSIFYLPEPDHMEKPLKKNFFHNNTEVARPPYIINNHDITCRFKLPCGTYCIVPWTMDSNQDGSFVLRIFSENQSNMELYDENMSLGTLGGMTSSQTLPSKEQDSDKRIQKIFLKVAGKDMEINWLELKEILDSTMKAETKNRGFSEDVCRSIVALSDEDRSGKLDYLQFRKLWIDINHWKAVFKSHDKDNSGTFSGLELREALNSGGYRVNNKILIDLVHRYGNQDYELNFELLILCALKIKRMTVLFRMKNESKSNNAKFSLDHWMEGTLNC